ncbi:hypothetical protein L8W58_07330 [Campylobacter lari]|nr:hypothetical protein [Campylobacter lari]
MKIKLPDLKKYAFNNRSDKTIYLGIETNILCVEDRINDISNFYSSKYNKKINDLTAILYIGKVIFQEEKNNLFPKFIASNFDINFEKLNNFWLNEIINNKVQYFRQNNNIILSKEQIYSYFDDLHSKNINLIKNYFNKIYENSGITALIYDKNNHKNDILNQLDTLSKQDYKITFSDELFYEYLVWSLNDFLIPYFSGKFQDENELLFNAGAYTTYKELYQKQINLIPNPYYGENSNIPFIDFFYTNINPLKYGVGYIEGYLKFFKHYPNSKFLKKMPPIKGYKFYSPNINYDGKILSSNKGKFYFSLAENPQIFIYFFQKYYPKICNLPKHWNEIMFQKLKLNIPNEEL